MAPGRKLFRNERLDLIYHKLAVREMSHGLQGRKSRGQGPAVVVRQYDGLLQNVKELSEVASQLGGASGEYLLDDCNAMVPFTLFQNQGLIWTV